MSVMPTYKPTTWLDRIALPTKRFMMRALLLPRPKAHLLLALDKSAASSMPTLR
jgi:hypothetical protein